MPLERSAEVRSSCSSGNYGQRTGHHQEELGKITSETVFSLFE
jgi:hypothetical protein